MTRTYEVHGCFDGDAPCISKDYEADNPIHALRLASEELEQVWKGLDGELSFENEDGTVQSLVHLQAVEREFRRQVEDLPRQTGREPRSYADSSIRRTRPIHG